MNIREVVIVLSCLVSAGVMAQENVFLSRDYWKENPTVSQIQKDIASGNDATVMNINAFDATVYALLEHVNDDSIKYLLSLEGNDTEKRTHDSRTYIFWAAYAGHTGIMRHLLEKGALIKGVKDSHGNTPVTFAASTGQKKPKVYNLFEDYGVVLSDEKNEDGVSALFLLAPFLETADELAYFESKGFSLADKGPKGNNLFIYAAKGGHIPFLKLLVDRGVSPTVINTDGGNAILYASIGTRNTSYNIETFKYLVNLGINANVIGDNGWNPLHNITYKSQDQSLINYLIEKRINVNIQDDSGNTPFMNAANRNTLAIVEQLANKVDNFDLKNNNGQTALTKAVSNNALSVISYLIEKGSDVNTIDTDGNTLAYYLLNTFNVNDTEDFEAKLELLQNHGLNMNLAQNNHKSLLHIATERNDLDALKRLSAFDIDINAKTIDGYTALHIASMKAKNDDILKYLISMGADVTIKTDFEESVYDLAIENEILQKNKVSLNFLK